MFSPKVRLADGFGRGARGGPGGGCWQEGGGGGGAGAVV